MSSNIVKGALISYLSIFLNIAISFFYTPWMIKEIGVNDYGLYSLVLSFISYFILDFGLSNATTRFIAKYRADDDYSMVSNMLGMIARVYFIIDAIIFCFLFIAYFFISHIFNNLGTGDIILLKKLYIIAGIFSIFSFLFKPVTGFMNAFEYFVPNKLIDMIIKVGTVLLICFALYFGAGVYALIVVNGAVSLFASIIRFVVFKKKSKLKINYNYINNNSSLKI